MWKANLELRTLMPKTLVRKVIDILSTNVSKYNEQCTYESFSPPHVKFGTVCPQVHMQTMSITIQGSLSRMIHAGR